MGRSLTVGTITVDTVRRNRYSLVMLNDANSTETTRGLHPWTHPVCVDLGMMRAAEAYLASRPLADQVAVLTLIREIEVEA